jgi:SPX domain protein involved in polyphosphate accumulation
LFWQTSELARRIREAEKDVKRLVAEDLSNNENSSTPERSPDIEHQRIEEYGNDEGSDDDLTDDEDGSDESYDALEDRFHGLEEEVAILVADVHDLALYTKLNITGFMKILKVVFVQSPSSGAF